MGTNINKCNKNDKKMKIILYLCLLLLCGVPSFCWTDVWDERVPVIIDTDIGQDFDDSWALALAVLLEKQINLKMVLTAAHNTRGRAQIVAKYLTIYNRTDVDIGVGVYQDPLVGSLYSWAKDFPLSSYKGKVHKDGLQAAHDLLHDAKAHGQYIHYVAIAPFVNFGSLIDRWPADVNYVGHIFAMAGSIKLCYGRKPPQCPEYNVADDVPASRQFFEAAWPLTFTPLDTCDWRLKGDLWEQLASVNQTSKSNVVLNTILYTYCWWSGWKGCTKESDTLFDPTAMLMLLYRDELNFKDLPIVINDRGETIVNSTGKVSRAALTWKEAPDGQHKFEQRLVDIMLKKKDVL